MRAFKKIAAAVTASLLAAGMMSAVSFAEDVYKIHVDSDSASVGDTVSVNVVIDAKSTGIGGISLLLNYDPQELELVSAEPGEELASWITGDESGLNLNEAGKIGFAYVTMSKGFTDKSVELIKASFNVLKPNAEITLDDILVSADDMDGTDITAQGSFEGTVVSCSHKNTEEKITPATCTSEGVKEVICSDCNATVRIETIAKTEHTWGEWVTKDGAVCGETTEKTRICEVCGATETVAGEVVEHSWDNGTVTTEPTCNEKGVKTFICTKCGATKTEEIAALGHTWNAGTVTVEPTCTEKGTKTFTCTVCGETKTEEIPALGHDWGEWTVVKEATEDEDGEEERECSVCGEKESRVIEKLSSATEDSKNPLPVYTGGSFTVPETTAASTSETESAAAAPATTASADNQTPVTTAATTTAATSTAAVSEENTPTGNDGSDNAAEGSASVGNVTAGNLDDKNSPTGVVLAVIPAAAAAAAAVIFKKRK